MSNVLLILSEDTPIAIPVFDEHVTVACMGIEGRVGDRYQPLRDRGDVIFTDGIEPRYYFAKHDIHFELIIDGRNGDVLLDSYKGLDSIPD